MPVILARDPPSDQVGALPYLSVHLVTGPLSTDSTVDAEVDICSSASHTGKGPKGNPLCPEMRQDPCPLELLVAGPPAWIPKVTKKLHKPDPIINSQSLYYLN